MPVGVASNDNRFASPGGVVKLFDRCEECIKVNEQDRPSFPRGKVGEWRLDFVLQGYVHAFFHR